MNDLDTFLSSVGLSTTEEVHTEVTQASTQSVPETISLTQEDIDELLAENGFPEVHDADAEEITEEEEEEEGEEENTYVENTEEATTAHTEFNSQDVADSEYNITQDVSSDTPVPPSDVPHIPENSATFLIDETTSRFSGTEWYNKIKESPIILAGLGGIGSWCALQIARLSPASMVLYDDDVVEAANMSGQFYGYADVGRAKANVVVSKIIEFTSTAQVYGVTERFTPTTEAGDIMICGFDNMEARKVFYTAWKLHVTGLSEERRAECLFLDGRLSVDCLQVLAIRGNDAFNMAKYEKEFLFDDAQADETICSMKQTTYLACMIGSFMTNLFVNFIAGTLDPVFPYALPFFTEYDAQNMMFKAEN